MNDVPPLVSVAMPVYNAEKYLKQAIDSILSQTLTDFELILVNDGSTDSSGEIIHSYSDKRIRYYENEQNLGITKTRNRCVHLSQGKYIAVLDNDDIALAERLEKQVDFLESNNQYGICGSFYDIIDESGKLTGKRSLPVADKEIRTYLLFENCFCNSSVMIKSDLLKNRKYTEDFNMIEDYHFLYSVSKFRKLANLPLYICQYRVHGKNTSIKMSEGMSIQRRKMDTAILSDLNISYSKEEFELHTHFVTGNFWYFNTRTRIAELEKWLLRLYQVITVQEQYDAAIVKKILISRWIFLFTRSKKISYRILFNRFFLKFRLKYIECFLKLIFEKYSFVKSAS